MLEQAELLEPGQLGAHGRRAPGDVLLLGQPLRRDGLIEVHVSLDELAQDERLPRGDLHGPKSRVPSTRGRKFGRESASGWA